MFNPVCPCMISLSPYTGKLKYNFENIKSKFIHINIYLKVKCILTFLNVLTPKISLIHKNNHISNTHTLGDTRKISFHFTPLSPTFLRATKFLIVLVYLIWIVRGVARIWQGGGARIFFQISKFACLLWGNSHEEIFLNILRLMRFGVYFKRIFYIKKLFSCRNNYIIIVARLYYGVQGHSSPQNFFWKNDAFWCIFWSDCDIEKRLKNYYIFI